MIVEIILSAIAGFIAGFFFIKMLIKASERRIWKKMEQRIRDQDKKDFVIDGKRYDLVGEMDRQLAPQPAYAPPIAPQPPPEPPLSQLPPMPTPPQPTPPQIEEPVKKEKINVKDLMRGRK